jgi:hypothetical protein
VWIFFITARQIWELGSEFDSWKIPQIQRARACARFPWGLFKVNRETERVSGIKMISRLPWLRGMVCHRSACCLGHLREMATFAPSCQNATTSACIGFFLQCYFHFILNPIQVKIPIKIVCYLFLTKCARKDNIIPFTKACTQ